MLLLEAWADIVARYDARAIDIAGTLAVQVVFWWVPCLAFAALDRAAPAFSARHKIQPAARQPTGAEVRHAAAVSLRNQAIVVALQLVMAYHHTSSSSAAQGGYDDDGPRPLSLRVEAGMPGPGEVVRHLAVCVLAREALFYYAHRLLHARWLYQGVHKAHHRFAAPVAFASQYAHPAEHLLANALPIALPPLLLRAHVVTWWAFLAWQLVETATVHSGYDFFAGAARKHDRHHERFNVYFGGIGLLDWVHGTDEKKVREKGE